MPVRNGTVAVKCPSAPTGARVPLTVTTDEGAARPETSVVSAAWRCSAAGQTTSSSTSSGIRSGSLGGAPASEDDCVPSGSVSALPPAVNFALPESAATETLPRSSESTTKWAGPSLAVLVSREVMSSPSGPLTWATTLPRRRSTVAPPARRSSPISTRSRSSISVPADRRSTARPPAAVRTRSLRVSVSPFLIAIHCPSRSASTVPVAAVTWNVAVASSWGGAGASSTAVTGETGNAGGRAARKRRETTAAAQSDATASATSAAVPSFRLGGEVLMAGGPALRRPGR